MKHLQSQRGAALILVLFIVVFIAIAGTMMLNSTIYSQKTILANEEVQGEFYRAEGALDLVLEEMNQYEGDFIEWRDANGEVFYDSKGEPILIQQTGPFFYLEDNVTPSSIEIGSEIIKVKMDAELVNPNQYIATITANYLNKDSSINRVLELDVSKLETPKIEYSGGNGALEGPIQYVSSFNHNGSTVHDELDVENTTVNMTNSTFQSIKNHLNTPVTHDKLFNITESHEFPAGRHYPNSINYSGNENQIDIKPGAVVFAKNVNLTGGGNSSYFKVDGILVVDDLNVSGNIPIIINGALIVMNHVNITGGADITINSGIIANNFATTGANRFGGMAKGINCSLLGISNCGGTPEVSLWTSSILNIKYQTLRN
ncbi:hypothetical protein [Bacillus solitudinis]|uniref:hypothetical protein n=1 Tax=Bacillus solitudinis TaxID=2014074 RepID=UPI0012FD76CB|nr:hypothetical protein [Bacillus solitudinis]